MASSATPRRRPYKAVAIGVAILLTSGAGAYWWLRDPLFQSRVLGTATNCVRPCDAAFAHDGTVAAYIASDGLRQRVVLTSGGSSIPFDQIANPVFSERSKLLAFNAREGAQWSVILSGTRGPSFDFIQTAQFRPGTDELWYVASDGRPPRVRAILIGPSIRVEGDHITAPVFSVDGAHVAYVVRSGNRSTVWADGKSAGPFDDLVTDLRFTDSGRVRYLVRVGTAWRAYENGQPVEDRRIPERAEKATFGKTGELLAYSTQEGDKHVIVFRGRRGQAHGYVDHPVVAPDERSIAYKTEDQGIQSVESSTAPAAVLADSVSDLQYTPDGLLLYTYSADGERWLVAGDRRRRLPGEITSEWRFHPSGRKVAFGVLQGHALRWEAIDLQRRDTSEWTTLSPASLAFWTQLRHGSRAANGLELRADGALLRNGRPFTGWSLDQHVTRIAISPASPGGRYALTFTKGDETVAITLLDFQQMQAGVIQPSAPFRSWVSWSEDGKFAAAHSYYEGEDRLWIVEPDRLLSREIVTIGVGRDDDTRLFDTDLLQWTGPTKVTVPILVHCNPYAGSSERPCEDRSVVRAQFVTTVDVETGYARSVRTGIADTSDAEAHLNAYHRAIADGRMADAVGMVAAAERPRIDGEFESAMRAFEPVFKFLGERTRVETTAITLDANAASARVLYLVPETRQTPAARRLDEQMFGLMFMSGLQRLGGQQEQDEAMMNRIRIINEEFVAGVSSIPQLPTRTLVARCNLRREQDGWKVEAGCGQPWIAGWNSKSSSRRGFGF